MKNSALIVLVTAASMASAACGKSKPEVAPPDARVAPAEVCPGLDWAACSAAAATRFQAKDYAGALPMFAAACTQGRVGVACSNWGWMVERGEGGVRADPVEALRIFDLGCTLGTARSCAQQAGLLRAGNGVAADPKRAFELDGKACEAGDGFGCYQIGLAHHRAVPPNLIEARTNYIKACNAKLADGCHEAGRLLEAGAGGPVDLAQAYNAFIGAETLGRARSVIDAARLWLGGKITLTATTTEEAVRGLLDRACKLDDWASCTELGWRLEDAGNPLAYKKQIRELATRACDGGHGPACDLLGWHITEDNAGPMYSAARVRDALKAYERGCALGHAEACARVGELVGFACDAVTCDRARAATLLAKGCDTDRLEFACVARAELSPDAATRTAELGRYCGMDMGLACMALARDLLATQAKAAPTRAPLDAYMKACTLKLGEACHEAAGLVTQVEKAPAGPQKARELYGQACALGHRVGCLGQADMMYAGLGGPVDVTAADAIMTAYCTDGGSDICSIWCSTRKALPICARW